METPNPAERLRSMIEAASVAYTASMGASSRSSWCYGVPVFILNDGREIPVKGLALVNRLNESTRIAAPGWVWVTPDKAAGITFRVLIRMDDVLQVVMIEGDIKQTH